jgi:hypothetical protein
VTRHDAAWTLQKKRGTCENYAQLSLALLRSVGIPARYVSGYLVGGDITVSGPISTYGYRWDAGPHAWIEVYYPDIGWVPYEPQKTLGFVDNHHVRESVGTDSSDVPNKLIYTYTASGNRRVTISDSSDVTLVRDTSTLHVVNTSAASSQGVISQEMAHGGVINDRINAFDSETLVSQLAVPIMVALGVVASFGFLLARRRRR